MDVIVDDNDPLVRYSAGGWAKGGRAGVEFDGTTHSSGHPGDTAVLAFNGISIKVFGTLGFGQGTMNSSVDGAEPFQYSAGPRPAASHNQKFWESEALAYASHELTITVDQYVPFPNTTFFLDYFVYNTTTAAGKTILMDDSALNYSLNGWRSFQLCDGCLNGTEHIAEEAASSVAINFEGTLISVFGTLGGVGADISVDIDGSQATMDTTHDRQLFVSRMLTPGSHVMNITSLTANAVDIDYLLVAPNTATTAASAASGSATGSQQASTKPSTDLPIGAIVGGAVGGLAFLALVFVAVLTQNRRLNRQPGTESASITAVHPFVLSDDNEDLEPPPYTVKYTPSV
ncbi:hypothetical protein DFH06DRAFT_1297409 [Mycena polygramma]|nr:hypothetical protein DFH06DRAFT_1297409 [Mycena polygramma]